MSGSKKTENPYSRQNIVVSGKTTVPPEIVG